MKERKSIESSKCVINVKKSRSDLFILKSLYLYMRVCVPVRTCGVAEWGTIAASCGRDPISGSGVLLGGELASEDITILGFSCTGRHTYRFGN